VRALDVAGDAGTAFDGRHLFQIAGDRILKIDPKTGRVLATIPAPGGGGDSGSRGPRARSGSGSIATGRSIRSIPRRGDPAHDRVEPLRHGVTWVDGELWHGTWEGDESDVRRIDPRTGEVLERLEMPPAWRLGARVRRRRPALLRRRQQRQGEGRPSAEATLTG
jgi:hypothetical protein